MKDLVGLDYETKRIGDRPDYPPVPVGVAIDEPGIGRDYLAWGHPSGNTCTKAQAVRRLKELYRKKMPVFFNAAFDLEVGEAHLGLPVLDWNQFHDVLFLAFIHSPRSRSLELKVVADEFLDMAPIEQNKLRDWILANIPEAAKKPDDWGAYISDAPGTIVSPYAKGDVKRNLALFRFFVKELTDRDKRWPSEGGQNSFDAYDRERRFMLVKMKMERRGIRTDTKRLKKDVPLWLERVNELETAIIKKLGGPKRVAQFAKTKAGFNVGSKQQLADALEAAGMVTHFHKTPKGNRSLKKDLLLDVISNKEMAHLISKRDLLVKYINTYGQKWIDVGERAGGFVFPTINQVRNGGEDDMSGARTGRLSYSDSWQAIPKPERVPYPDLPVLRDYIIPDEKDHLIAVRDYSQQEFRILAHYEDGPLLMRYLANPFLDMHQGALEMINELTGLGLDPEKDRRPVKDTGFGLIYGMGDEKTAKKTGQTIEMARTLKNAYLAAIPGLKDLLKGIKRRCARGEPIRTWGGRLYWVEEPRIIQGRLRTFEYKMINVLIQGSAADNTKEACIVADEAFDPRYARLVMTVHDEIVASIVKARLRQQMNLLREAMESVPFDLPMLSDGKYGLTWANLKKYKDEKRSFERAA